MAKKSSSQKADEIKEFIFNNLESHPNDITKLVIEKYGLSRQAVNRYINSLVNEGKIHASGSTRSKKYEVVPQTKSLDYKISYQLKEDVVWRNKILPLINDIPKNILAICEYGFTEMLNNAIDHSEGKKINVTVKRELQNIKLNILDDGIGIFKKIQTALNLTEEREAILELTKGKFTTDPAHHTGEGIFFTSRVFDIFSILSDRLSFIHEENSDDWLIENDYNVKVDGTYISMIININSERTLQDVFNKFASPEFDYSFNVTHVPVSLAKYGGENLVSRSQAKRVLLRFEKFREVFLDFKGVEIIGQAFADEIFRVFAIQNPSVKIVWANTNKAVEQMIMKAVADKEEYLRSTT